MEITLSWGHTGGTIHIATWERKRVLKDNVFYLKIRVKLSFRWHLIFHLWYWEVCQQITLITMGGVSTDYCYYHGKLHFTILSKTFGNIFIMPPPTCVTTHSDRFLGDIRGVVSRQGDIYSVIGGLAHDLAV